MPKKNGSFKSMSHGYPHTVKTERLNETGIELSSFFFRFGANSYVFTYEKSGEKKHTFIDTGYKGHQRQIFSILENNHINLKNIENIIITHRHPDHSGLADTLVDISGGKILVHANFKEFVEGGISDREKRWLGKFDPSRLKNCPIEYLDPGNGDGSIRIGGMDFPRMKRTVDLGNEGKLEILAIPESTPTHSPDQLVILYSPRNVPYVSDGVREESGFRPTDEMIFAGDLWLMKGPVFQRNLRSLSMTLKFFYFRFLDFISGKDQFKIVPSEQDAGAKDALKQGFSLIRVKPGHGNEFLGTNMIPKTLLADRDLLLKLGFKMDHDKSVLQSDPFAGRVSELRETAYAGFLDTLNLWLKMGYEPDEICALLTRIYMEQSDGGKLVEEDRKERRKRLEETLDRLASEKMETDPLYHIGKCALAAFSRRV